MTRDETKKILRVIDNVYPNWHPKDPTLTANVWSALFKDYDYADVGEALRRYMVSDQNGFAPVPGQLIDILHTVEDDGDNSELDAWNLVRKAIGNGNYHAKEEYDNLPRLVQLAVGPYTNLTEWAMMDTEAVGSVIQSNFLRAYRTVVKREREKRRYEPDSTPRIESQETPMVTEKPKPSVEMKNDHEFDMENEFTKVLLERFGQNPAKETA